MNVPSTPTDVLFIIVCFRGFKSYYMTINAIQGHSEFKFRNAYPLTSIYLRPIALSRDKSFKDIHFSMDKTRQHGKQHDGWHYTKHIVFYAIL